MPSTADGLQIVPLTPDRLPALAALFGEGGDPRFCWCAWFRMRSAEFSGASMTDHRAVMEAATGACATAGRAPGLIALDAGRAVGWVSVGPRTDYPRLAHSRALAPVDERQAWAVVCFVVSRRARGRGLAHALLEAAVAYARAHGAEVIEAYPEDARDGRVSDARAYKGTLAMFERAGFRVATRRRANAASAERPIARLELA